MSETETKVDEEMSSSSFASIKDERRRRRSRTPPPPPPSSPLRDRSKATSTKLSRSSSATSRSASTTLIDTTSSQFEDLTLNPNYNNPRSFPYTVKQRCWDKAEKVKGRDPERWRRDAIGNIVFRKLVGCPGCLCHDYDHILPYSKGGESTLENCQVLQATVNRSKGNRTDMSKAELIQKSRYCKVSDRDMDLLEISAYGTVQRGPGSGGCRIQ